MDEFTKKYIIRMGIFLIIGLVLGVVAVLTYNSLTSEINYISYRKIWYNDTIENKSIMDDGLYLEIQENGSLSTIIYVQDKEGEIVKSNYSVSEEYADKIGSGG